LIRKKKKGKKLTKQTPVSKRIPAVNIPWEIDPITGSIALPTTQNRSTRGVAPGTGCDWPRKSAPPQRKGCGACADQSGWQQLKLILSAVVTLLIYPSISLYSQSVSLV